MSKRTDQFLVDLTAMSAALAKARDETIDYWAPEPPPVTTAYADVGRRLVDELPVMDAAERRAIFEKIESGMRSDDEAVGIAVATGLIEGLIARSVRIGNWPAVRRELGPDSQAHADAWHGS